MSLILDGTNGLSDVDGSAATPAIRGSDANTGIFFDSDVVGLSTDGTERVRVDASGNVGIGTSSPGKKLDILSNTSQDGIRISGSSNPRLTIIDTTTPVQFDALCTDTEAVLRTDTNHPLVFSTNGTERARIDSDGILLVGKTSTSLTVAGCRIEKDGSNFVRDNGTVIFVNRQSTDGDLIGLCQAGTQEGSISVSGSTVSYNGGHLSRWAQTLTAKDESLVKGTVLSNLDEMNVYTDADGNPVQNEQLNKVKVSDVEGDANVAGVFVNWTHDDAHDVDEINMAMTGDMIIRIAQGVTVARGDLLMSAGDGTAKPQGDDIVRSKTIAKVTSTHVTCTYADGSFCVPCVLMAC
jgi:hypothetical protein